MTELDLRDTTLVGHSMGTGEVARYVGTFGSERVDKAVFVAPLPPFLLKTADNPEGVDDSIFDAIMQSIAADRFAYLSTFFSDFYNLDVTLGNRTASFLSRLRASACTKRSRAANWWCWRAGRTAFPGPTPKR